MIQEFQTSIAGLSTTVAEAKDARANFVFLHGYDMERGAFAPFARSLRLPVTTYFPEASLTVSEGGFSWWPVDQQLRAKQLQRGPRDLAHTTPPGRHTAREQLAAFLGEIRRKDPAAPLILGGFSQGGMLAFDVALRACSVAALVLLSASRVAIENDKAEVRDLSGVPALVAHGSKDRNISITAGRALADDLKQRGCAVEFLEFDGDHETPLPVWRAVRKFIANVIEAHS